VAPAPEAPKADAPAQVPAADDSGSLLDEGFAAQEEAAKADAPAKDEPKAEADAKAPEKDVKAGAPEAYEDFAIPEGLQAAPEALEQFKSLAKSMNLSQENAQKLVDMQASMIATQAEAALHQYKQTTENWKSETKQMLGPDYKKQLAVAARAIERFGTPELRTLMNETGLGNHKAFVSFAMKAGHAIAEDKFAEGRPGAVGPKSAAETLYPDHSRR
jgi:hypothetical protein